MNDSVLPWVLERLLDAAANRWAASWTLEGKVPALARLNPGGKLVGGRTDDSVETLFTESLSVPEEFPVPNVPRRAGGLYLGPVIRSSASISLALCRHQTWAQR